MIEMHRIRGTRQEGAGFARAQKAHAVGLQLQRTADWSSFMYNAAIQALQVSHKIMHKPVPHAFSCRTCHEMLKREGCKPCRQASYQGVFTSTCCALAAAGQSMTAIRSFTMRMSSRGPCLEATLQPGQTLLSPPMLVHVGPDLLRVQDTTR